MHPMPQHVLFPDCLPPGLPRRGRNGIATSPGQKENKRRRDCNYRIRQKMKKEEQEVNLKKLREQNIHLKTENEACRKENELINRELQSKLMEITEVRSEIENSKRDIANQETVLETFSQQPFLQLMVGSGQFELALLENERSMFYQEADQGNWILERELLDEIKKLRDRNVILKMKNQVLADKILSSQGP